MITSPIQMRFRDADAFGHVNNAVYLSYFEIARLELDRIAYREIGGTVPWTSGTGVVIPVLARQEIAYLVPMTVRADGAAVSIWVTRLGRSSLSVGYRITDPEQSTVHALGRSMTVFIDTGNGRSTAMPHDYRSGLGNHIGEDVVFPREGQQ